MVTLSCVVPVFGVAATPFVAYWLVLADFRIVVAFRQPLLLAVAECVDFLPDDSFAIGFLIDVEN